MSSRFSLSQDLRIEIIKRLIKKGLTKYENEASMCRDYNLPPGTLGHWKKEGKMNIAFILKFSLDYGVSLDWLFLGIEPEDLPKGRLLRQKFETIGAK